MNIPKNPTIHALRLNVNTNAVIPKPIAIHLKNINTVSFIRKFVDLLICRFIISGSVTAKNPPNTLGWGNVAYDRRTRGQPRNIGKHRGVCAMPGETVVNTRSPNHQNIPPTECCSINCHTASTDEYKTATDNSRVIKKTSGFVRMIYTPRSANSNTFI